MANQWFRSWHGAPTDTKWLAIAKRAGVAAGIVSAIAWALFDYASQQEDRGSIEGFDQEGYAAFSGFEEQQVGATIIALKDKGLIENNRLKSWSRRQPQKEDFNAKDRKRKQRDKENVTPCHAPSHDVTTDKTRLDKDKIKKERKEALPRLAVRPENISENIWDDFIRQRKAKFTQTALTGIEREVAKAGITLEEGLRVATERGWQSFKADWVKEKAHETNRKNKSEQLDDILGDYLAEQGITNPTGEGADRGNASPVLRSIQHLREEPGGPEEHVAGIRGTASAVPG